MSAGRGSTAVFRPADRADHETPAFVVTQSCKAGDCASCSGEVYRVRAGELARVECVCDCHFHGIAPGWAVETPAGYWSAENVLDVEPEGEPVKVSR